MSEATKLNLYQLLRGMDLTSTERDVLAAMASYGDYDLTNIWPSLPTVAKDYGLDVKTVRRAVKSMRTKGILKLVNEGTGGASPAKYAVILPDQPLPPDGRGHPSHLGTEPLPPDAPTPAVSRPDPSRQAGDDQSLTSSLPSKTKAVPPMKSPSPDAVQPKKLLSLKNENEESPLNPFDPDAFERWLGAYPKKTPGTFRRIPRRDVEAAYRDALKRTFPAMLQATVEAYARDISGHPEFVMLPTNWLRTNVWRRYVEAYHPEPSWPSDETLRKWDEDEQREQAYVAAGHPRPNRFDFDKGSDGRAFEEALAVWHRECRAWAVAGAR